MALLLEIKNDTGLYAIDIALGKFGRRCHSHLALKKFAAFP